MGGWSSKARRGNQGPSAGWGCSGRLDGVLTADVGSLSFLDRRGALPWGLLLSKPPGAMGMRPPVWPSVWVGLMRFGLDSVYERRRLLNPVTLSTIMESFAA